MRKTKLILFSIFLLFIAILGFNLRIKANNNSAISMLGAQIRTSEPCGIRFVGQVEAPIENASYGIALARGACEASQIEVGSMVNGYRVINTEVSQVNGDNQFFVTLIEIPVDLYDLNISARAYYKVDEVITYSEEIVIRSMASVSKYAHDNGDESELVNQIYNTYYHHNLVVDSNDLRVFNLKSPDIIVNKNIVDGEYEITQINKTFKYGTSAFSNINDALAKVSNNQSIYVFSGTYDESIDITKSNVLLYGPNYNIDGKDERQNEAIITQTVNIHGNYATLDGLKFIDNGAIRVSANNVVINHDYIYTTTIACNGNNRQGCIVDGANISNLSILNSYIKVKGVTASHTTDYLAFTNINTLTIEGNYICNEATSLSTTCDGMMIYNASGVFNIKNNEIRYATNGWLLRIYSTNTITEFNFIENIVSGRDNLVTCTIGVLSMKSYCVAKFIGNEFYNVDPSTISFSNSVAGSTAIIKYNYFDPQKTFKIYHANETLTTNNNCYAGGFNANDGSNARNDEVTYNTLEEVRNAYNQYKASLNSMSSIVNHLDSLYSNLDPLKENINLITSYNDATISWSSSNSTIISNSGIVSRPLGENIDVSLSATVTLNSVSETFTYQVQVAHKYKDLSEGGIAAGYLYTNLGTTPDSFYSTIDIIYLAFAEPSSTGTVSDTYNLANKFKNNNIVSKGHANGDYVLFSINNASRLSAVAADATLRTTFANSIVDFINNNNLDGVDIDWEFPASSEKGNFTLLMKEIREKVKENNSEHLVTVATGIDTYTRYDFTNSNQYIDYINVMTYDMQASTATFHNALYHKAGKDYKAISNTATYYINNSNISPSKLILGIPFYGKKYTNTDGLGQTGSGPTAITYGAIKSDYLENPNFGTTITRTLDPDCKVPYIYDSLNKVFISYEDPESIVIKMNYIKTNGWAGIFMWQNGQDDSEHTLLKAITDNKANMK